MNISIYSDIHISEYLSITAGRAHVYLPSISSFTQYENMTYSFSLSILLLITCLGPSTQKDLCLNLFYSYNLTHILIRQFSAVCMDN